MRRGEGVEVGMCVCATAKRRRRQAAMGYRHLALRQRRRYKRHSGETYDKRATRAAEKRKAQQLRKRKKG